MTYQLKVGQFKAGQKVAMLDVVQAHLRAEKDGVAEKATLHSPHSPRSTIPTDYEPADYRLCVYLFIHL